jgi:hypothetical protein
MGEKGNIHGYNRFNQVNSKGELIIELRDDIFIVNENRLGTPVDDEFEYEIVVDDSSTQR